MAPKRSTKPVSPAEPVDKTSTANVARASPRKTTRTPANQAQRGIRPAQTLARTRSAAAATVLVPPRRASLQSAQTSKERTGISPATRAQLDLLEEESAPSTPEELERAVRSKNEGALVRARSRGDQAPGVAGDEDDSFTEAREEMRQFMYDVKERLDDTERAAAERVAVAEDRWKKAADRVVTLEKQMANTGSELKGLTKEVAWCKNNCSELGRETCLKTLESQVRGLE